MIFSENSLRHFTYLHTNFRVESVNLSGVKGAKGEDWYGETKWATYERPMRDLWATGFWDLILRPSDSTSKNTYPCQFSRRGDRSLTAKSGHKGPKEVGQKSAREFELSLAQPLCWRMQNQGVLIDCREIMWAPSHVHFNPFFCTLNTF